MILLTLAYYLGGRLGLAFPYYGDVVSLIWPPAGIAIATLTLRGKALWPGIFLGSFLVNMAFPLPIAAVAAIAAGSSLAAVAAATLLRRCRLDPGLNRLSDTAAFTVLGVVLPTAIAATIGAAAVVLAQGGNWSGFRLAWLGWWLGDAMGVLVIGGLLLVLFAPGQKRWSRREYLEAAAVIAVLAALGGIGLTGQTEMPFYLALPVITWSALRLGPVGAAVAVFEVTAFSTLAVAAGSGAFLRQNLQDSLLHLHGFTAAFAVTALMLAASIGERRRAEAALRQARETLEDRVAQRTAELEHEIAERGEAERALRDSESCLSAVFHQTFQFMGLLNIEGRLLKINTAALDLIGDSEEEVTGQYFWDTPWWAHSTEDRERLHHAVAEAQAGKTSRFEVTHPTAAGGIVHVDFSLKPIREQNGAVTLLIAEGRDITERKLAEIAVHEREEFYKRMFRSNPAPKLLIDPQDGVIVDANDAAQAYYGYPLDRLAKMRITDINILPVEDTNKEMQAAKSEQRLYFMFKHRLASGEIRDVEVYSGPVRIGGRMLLHSIIHDVTQRNRFERALIEKTEALTRSNRELEEFASVASHDLQEPLRMVSSYVQLLQRRYHGKLDADADAFIDYAVAGAKRMQTLILDLLDYSRLTRRQPDPCLLDTGAVLGSVLHVLGDSIRAAGADITLPPDMPHVTADKRALESVFQNLLSNAVKYRDPARALHVAVEAAREGYVWHFIVRDNGIGIDPAYFDKIFLIFQRLHGPEAYEGTGIGLSLVKRSVDMLGGKVWLESAPGQGSVFHFTVPAEAAAA